MNRLACLTMLLLPSVASPLLAQRVDPLREGLPVPAGCVGIFDGATVTSAEFVDHLVLMFCRPGHEGDDVVNALIDEAIITRHRRERGIVVSDADVEAKFRELDDRVRQSGGKSLTQTLQDEGVPESEFRSKLRRVAELEKLVPSDLKLPAHKPVTDLHMKTWLTQRRQTAVVVRNTDPSADVLLTVDGEPVSKQAFAKDFVVKEKPELVRRTLDTLFQQRLAQRMLAERGLELTDADVLAEWAYRKAEFESDPQYRGLSYDEMVKQQTSWDAATYQRSPGFRVHAAVGLLGRKSFSTEELQAAYAAEAPRLGPIFTVGHILIRASDNERLKGQMPTFAEAERTAGRVLADVRAGKRFEDLASLYSEDQGTKFRGGRLNPFTPGTESVDPNLRAAAAALQVDQIAEAAVRSKAGFHIVKLLARDPTPALEAVEGRLRRVLAERTFRERFLAAPLGVDVRF